MRAGCTHAVQWLKNDRNRSEEHPLDGSVVQRLQRFATYGSLKQQVLRIITDELAISNERGQDALKKARRPRAALGAPCHVAARCSCSTQPGL